MCSIMGVAGPIDKLPPKLKTEFHNFLSILFTMCEYRGRDAAGFWVWRKNHYIFEKRPVAAQDLIYRSVRWKSLKFNPGTLYLCHTRLATEGNPNDNINNHPHVGDHSVMIHNGCIVNFKQLVEKHKLELASSCDSEVLLRVAEKSSDISEGIKQLYRETISLPGLTSVACAFIDRRTPDKIYLSRNHGNPCYLYSAKKFGCNIFVSTKEIFDKALCYAYNTKSPDFTKIGATGGEIETFKLYTLRADGGYSSVDIPSYSTPSSHVSRDSFGKFTSKKVQQPVVIDDFILCDSVRIGAKYYSLDIEGELIEDSDTITDDDNLEFSEADSVVSTDTILDSIATDAEDELENEFSSAIDDNLEEEPQEMPDTVRQSLLEFLKENEGV